MKYASLIYVSALFYWMSSAQAVDTSTAIIAAQQAMQNMQAFNPASQIPSFTNTPLETAITVAEDDDRALSSLGQTRAAEDATASFVRSEEKTRQKEELKQHQEELSNAENLLERPSTPSNTACAGGECDSSLSQESDDANEGLSRLGTIAGTADEVSRLQVNTGNPNIFKGYAQECKKYPLNIRDCCTDDGFLDGLINCPSELQSLQRAKVDHRVMFVGQYTPHFYSATHYVYCVFPSKLAGIIQIQGRFSQLGIWFGPPKTPDCRGITPEELSRLDFNRLDMSELVAEFTSKKTFPQYEAIENKGQDTAQRLHQNGATHD